MITYREVDKTFFAQYDKISMNVFVEKEFIVKKVNNGLGGFLLNEEPVTPYIKDLSQYEVAMDYEKHFNIDNWQFFMAFDGVKPVGGMTLVCNAPDVNMLDGRNDLCILWDIRVQDEYKQSGIGQNLFNLGVEWAQENGLKQMKIECQNNNVPACKFYHKQGAILSKIDEYAYYGDEEIMNEVQLIWYLDL